MEPVLRTRNLSPAPPVNRMPAPQLPPAPFWASGAQIADRAGGACQCRVIYILGREGGRPGAENKKRRRKSGGRNSAPHSL